MLNKIRNTFFSSVLLFSLIAKGQSAFNTYYPSGSLSSAAVVQSLTPGGYLVTSYFKDSTFGQQGLDLRKLDNTGQTLLHKRYMFGNLDFLSFGNNKMQCNISNSTILLTGGAFTGTMSTVIFASVNKTTLDTNWSKKYFDGVFEYNLSHVFKIKPNEMWLMGVRFKNTGYLQRPTIIKMDTLGNVLSVKEFTAMIGYETRQIFYDTLSNRFYIAGENYNTPPNNPYHIVCIDTAGSIVWNKLITTSSLFVYQVKKVANELICSGSLQVSYVLSSGENRLNLFKLNAANGNTIWNRLYGLTYKINTLTDFFEQADGSIICAGSYSDKPINNSSNHDACLLKVDSNGDSLWMRTYSNYGQGVQEYIFDLQQCGDGGYIMCGASNYANPTHAWVIKTDSLGIAPGMINVGVKELKVEDYKLKIYPNPANDKLNIQFTLEGLNNEFTKAEIVNSIGQVIKVVDLNYTNKTSIINISDLANGVYLLNLRSSIYTGSTTNNTVSLSKRFVIAR